MGRAGRELSLTESVVLALLAEGPTHGFAIAKELRPDADLGRVLTVHRPVVYRALDRLVASGLAEVRRSEPGDGPDRTVHRITRRGRARVDGWLGQPVAHVRDLRIDFLVKLRLNQRRGRPLGPLVEAQRGELADTFAGLAEPPSHVDADVVDRWRRRNALAASAFLDELAGDVGAEPSPSQE